MRCLWLVALLGLVCVEAQNCEDLNNKSCLNNFFEDKPCEFDFPLQQCLNATQDVCQAHADESTCNSGGCLFDPYLNNCLASLSQINSVYDCGYWSGYAAESTNPACIFHGCLYDSVIRQCVVANATLTPKPNAPPINAQVRFVNPSFDVENQQFSVQGITPFVYTEQTPTHPEFPIFLILFAASDPGFYASQANAQCSTFQQTQLRPFSFTTTANPAAVQTYFTQTVNANHTLDFDGSPFGALLNNVFGRPLISKNAIVKSVSYANGNLVYNLSISALNATNFCNQQGAQAVDDDNGRVYTLPISYIQHTVNDLHVQVVQTYKITVPLRGTVVIGAQTTYGTAAYPRLITFTRGQPVGCGADEGRLNIQFQIDTYNVYDPSVRVGVFSPSDVLFRAPTSPAGPVNCYGDQLETTSFTPVSCDYSTFVCSQQLTVTSRCRALRTDGNAFNECQYSFAQDRIADMNGDFPYPTTLNALHTLFFYRRVCPLSQVQVETCPFVTSSPETVSARILGSSYLETTSTVNGFFVQSGFVDSPTADLSDPAAVMASNGTVHIKDTSLVTLVAVMQLASRSTYSLRAKIQNAETRIVPLNDDNLPLNQVSGYSGKALLTYNDFKSSLLYVSKTQFDQGCGIEDSCLSLPACQNILGCDGFSLPASSLLRLMPAPRYAITFAYKVVLPLTQPTPAARRLLQTGDFDLRDTYTFVIELTPTFSNTTVTNSTLVNGTCTAQNETVSDPVLYCQALLRAAIWPSQPIRPVALRTIGPIFGASVLAYSAFSALSFFVANKLK